MSPKPEPHDEAVEKLLKAHKVRPVPSNLLSHFTQDVMREIQRPPVRLVTWQGFRNLIQARLVVPSGVGVLAALLMVLLLKPSGLVQTPTPLQLAQNNAQVVENGLLIFEEFASDDPWIDADFLA